MKEWKLRLCQMALEVRRKVTEVSLKERAMQRRAEFQVLVQGGPEEGFLWLLCSNTGFLLAIKFVSEQEERSPF